MARCVEGPGCYWGDKRGALDTQERTSPPGDGTSPASTRGCCAYRTPWLLVCTPCTRYPVPTPLCDACPRRGVRVRTRTFPADATPLGRTIQLPGQRVCETG